MRRMFDIVAATLGLLLTSWLIGLLCFAIRAQSKGPGLFRQTRLGCHKRPFTCYKLRTMKTGTMSGPTHLVSASSVTSLGHRLRKWKVDELPQLWNVLMGDMSLVGPRPCLPSQDELIQQREVRSVFSIRPGITGLGQIRGIDMSNHELLAQTDAEYLAKSNFVYDMKIIKATILGAGRGDRTTR